MLRAGRKKRERAFGANYQTMIGVRRARWWQEPLLHASMRNPLHRTVIVGERGRDGLLRLATVCNGSKQGGRD